MQQTATGSLVWFDIPMKDFEKSKAFYTGIFGWKIEFHKEMPYGKYYQIFGEEGPIGGLYEHDECGSTTFSTVNYFTVESVDAALAKVEGLGGKLFREKKDLSEGNGWIAHVLDPSGVIIGLWSLEA